MRPAVRARLDNAIGQLGPLPVLGGTVARVRALADDPDASTPALVAVIEADESFSTNLLRYANSAALARPLRAHTIHQAVTVVGRNALGRIALEAATYQFLSRVPGAGGVSRGHMHMHAVTVAACAAELAQRTGGDDEIAHLGGLLHDVGKLVMPIAFGEDACDEIARIAVNGCDRARIEHDRLGVDHAYAGALLTDQSQRGRDELFDAIAFHHGGRSGQETPTVEAACVQLANAITGMLAGEAPDQELLHAALVRVGGTPSLLDEVAEAAAPGQAASATGDDALAQRVASLERLASTDDLTGLWNRREWLARTRARLAAGEAGTVLICDVDHFKQVNDRVGHLTADLVLTEVARLLRSHGNAGRLGGDEFAMWVPGDLATASDIASRIVAETSARLPGDDSLPAVTLSVGAAPTSVHGHDLTQLLHAADTALYEAKAEGRGRAAVAAS